MNEGAIEERDEPSALAGRIMAVQERIATAARRSGRDPQAVTLVAVTKTHSAATVAAAYAAGLGVFGENRVEEAGLKVAAVAELVAPAHPPVWHMVGHVQSRKAAAVFPWAAMVHSLDGEKLGRRLSQFAGQAAAPLPVLIEVNVSGEASKYGLPPERVPGLVEAAIELTGLQLQGLMTVAPVAARPEDVRPVFATLRRLRDDLARRFPAVEWRHLSMGMSDDFEVAIEEGATMVRIGRALFGERPAGIG